MKPVYFTDRDLGKQFPKLLQGAGLAVETHAAHFAHDTPDERWLALVGRRGWVALTHDRQIRYKPNELAAVAEHRVALLLLMGHAKTSELAENFIRTRSKIERFLAGASPPYIAKVYRPSPGELARNASAKGRVERWWP